MKANPLTILNFPLLSIIATSRRCSVTGFLENLLMELPLNDPAVKPNGVADCLLMVTSVDKSKRKLERERERDFKLSKEEEDFRRNPPSSLRRQSPSSGLHIRPSPLAENGYHSIQEVFIWYLLLQRPFGFCSSEAMDPTASKLTTSSKGKRYKGISTKHPYKKPVTVKEEVLEFSSPQSARPSVSSSVPKSSSRPKLRVSVETVVLDSDSSDSDDNVILSTLLHRTRSACSNQTTSPAKPQASGGVSPKVASPQPSEHTKYSGTPSSQASPKTAPPCEVDDEDDDSDDEDYAPGMEEKTEAEATSTSTENQSASLEKDPSDHRSTEEPELIRNARLLRTVSEVGPFYPRLIRELIVNLPSDFNDPSADEYQKVHIRGVCFNVSPELLNSYLGIILPADYAVSYPTPERLAKELTGGTVPVWLVDGQLPIASLTVKYSILHRIGITNWILSMHASTISTSLGHFVYLVGIGVKVNVGEFIFNHLLRHVDTFAIHILICFPRILSGFILAQQSTILTPLDIVGSAPRVIPLSMRLFQGAHFPDVAAEFDNAPGKTSTLSVSLANRLLQALIAESRALTRQISELTDCCTVLDAVIRDLRRAASGTTPLPSD
ncbi:flocculation protein FLO11-like [Cucumis melo var. makuwa]|uniref:Flocculation protein FLO11-like n=1 Tax=Cucumis melo var. makuwa TaxID=1194695 RepID=A0A5A7TLH4_CUCMM|nr:flocculation protein FLO11-like [Cucumis melo var. makuwa]